MGQHSERGAAAAATPTIKIRGSTMMMMMKMIFARAAAIFMEAGGMSGREGVIHTSVSAGDRTRDHAAGQTRDLHCKRDEVMDHSPWIMAYGASSSLRLLVGRPQTLAREQCLPFYTRRFCSPLSEWPDGLSSVPTVLLLHGDRDLGVIAHLNLDERWADR